MNDQIINDLKNKISKARKMVTLLTIAVLFLVMLLVSMQSKYFILAGVLSALSAGFIGIIGMVVFSVYVANKYEDIIKEHNIPLETINFKNELSIKKILLYFLLYALVTGTAIFNTQFDLRDLFIVFINFSITSGLLYLINCGGGESNNNLSNGDEYNFSSISDISHSDNWHSDASHPASFTNPISPNFPH